MEIIKRVWIAFIVLFLVLLSFSGCFEDTTEENLEDDNTHSNESKTLYVANTTDADYHSIQDAIDAASNGTTIIVKNGTYYETLTINDSVNLIGAGKNTTHIDWSNVRSNTQITGILINADSCTIEGFTLTKRRGTTNVIGITINSSYNNISHMTISNLSEGVYLKKNSNNNTISWNTISNNTYGIFIDYSLHNNLSNNQISSNREYGIYLLSFASNNMISRNCISFNEQGIQITASTQNTIVNNFIINNSKGLYCCCGGSFNKIILNTFKNNTEFNAGESSGLENGNYWNTDYPPYAGNYWDDYHGIDENDDGFGDTPYDVPMKGNKDHYPLMKPIENTICI